MKRSPLSSGSFQVNSKIQPRVCASVMWRPDVGQVIAASLTPPLAPLTPGAPSLTWPPLPLPRSLAHRRSQWNGSDYFGASVAAFHHLGRQHGYAMVYCESKGLHFRPLPSPPD